MTKWEKYWSSYPMTVGKTDYMKQVEKTVKGKSIPDWQFKMIISEICYHLDLKKDDILIDLCCGNGLITKELAKKCKQVVGVDFSQPLLEVANRDQRPVNVIYRYANVLNMDKMSQITSGPFNKISMYGGLQYFKKQDLITILKNIMPLSSDRSIILFGSVPDRKRKWKFYNTPKRWLAYIVLIIFGREVIGTWWDKEFIKRTCKQLDLQCEFHEESKEIHTAHYRFDVTISRVTSSTLQ